MARPPLAIYEQPLNERIRTLLRLESLFSQARHGIAGDTEWHSRVVIDTLLDILGVLAARGDLRTDLIKELERLTAVLARLEDSPGVDPVRLHMMLERCRRLTNELRSLRGAPGSELKDNDLLNSVLQRSGVAGGTCGFDIPAYQHWLLQPADLRRQQLQDWMHSLDNLRHAGAMILGMLRDGTEPSPILAVGGQFQQSLDREVGYQLVRVGLPADAPYFAEISGSKHFFTVRFMVQPDTRERPTQLAQDVEFQLSCCAL